MKDGKTVLFLCRCGNNIAQAIDFDGLKEWAREQKDVNLLAVSNLLCSPDGKKYFKSVLQNRKIKSVVVAACSPKLHEKTFQDLAEESGVNRGRLQMANIREQCAWVTPDKAEALSKAKDLINGAIRRSWLLENLKKRKMEALTDVVVIGGGIAGIEAALALSKANRKVYLVEKQSSLGGALIKSEETAPGMECTPCLLAPLLAEIRDDPNIEVLAQSEVSEVLGFFGNFSVKIAGRARYVENSCIACEECFEVCPVSVTSSFHENQGERKAVYTLFAGAVPAPVTIDRESCLHFTEQVCNACAGVCPFQAVNFDQKDSEITVQAGAVVLAAGFESGRPVGELERAHRELDNVLTLPEFERLVSSNGPTEGRLRLKNGDEPRTVAVIHCAGSLDPQGLPYCSSICCRLAIKSGDLIRKQLPEAQIINIHRDLVLNGPKDYRYYAEQKEAGTDFIHTGNINRVTIEKGGAGNRLRVSGQDFAKREVDLVILATGLKPPADMAELAALLTLELDEAGYPLTDHDVLHRTASRLDGIYIAGAIGGPLDAAGSVTSARSVAGDILGRLVPGRQIELEVLTAFIDETKCAGCKLCLTVCPYRAITFDRQKGVSVVNEAICRGCGTCSAACPSGASRARQFTDEQIYAEIGGILGD